MGRGSRNWRNGTACIGRLSHHCFGVSESYRQVGLNAGQVAEACRLYAEGWSLARLANRYDVTDMTVRRNLLLAGVVMRSPHERNRSV